MNLFRNHSNKGRAYKHDKVQLSVIMPVYNVEDYIEDCLNSLLSGINNEFEVEIILIDDGSTDHSLDICKKYSKRYPCIRLLSQKNSGQSVARNNAINIAKGSWITFVDSDDIVENNYISILFSIIDNCSSDSDMIFFKYKKFKYTIPQSDAINFDKYKLKSISKDTAMYMLTSINNWGNYLWDKIYRKEILLSNLLPEGRKYEDIDTLYKYVFRSKKIYLYDDFLYFYRQREGSTVHLHNEKIGIDELEARRNQLAFFKSYNYLKAYERARHYFIASCVRLISYNPMSKLYYTSLKYINGYSPSLKKDGFKLWIKVKLINYNPIIWLTLKKTKDRIMSILKYK